MASKFLFHIKTLMVLLVLGSASAIAAQQCSLKIEQLKDAPELRGFRLGMSQDQVKSRVPQIRFGGADKFGVVKTSINPLYDARFDKASFADVRTISLDFLDDKLTTLWIGYEGSFKWKTVDEFVSGISQSLELPATWSQKRSGRQLNCDGFSLLVSMIAGSPSVRLTDEVGAEVIASRREQVAQAEELAVVADRTTKFYYPSNCDALENVSTPNRITFENRAEAEKAGYKLAKECDQDPYH